MILLYYCSVDNGWLANCKKNLDICVGNTFLHIMICMCGFLIQVIDAGWITQNGLTLRVHVQTFCSQVSVENVIGIDALLVLFIKLLWS